MGTVGIQCGGSMRSNLFKWLFLHEIFLSGENLESEAR